jgi:phage replication-related protein YjqB (UPF0714/DUF867 family)
MARFDGTVRKSFSEQETLQNRGEHCSLDPARLASLGLSPRTQIRVIRSAGVLGLYTVSETRQESDETTIRMAQAGRDRLQGPDTFAVEVDTQVPNPAISDDDARAGTDFIERLDDDGSQTHLVALAPHGGLIEQFTDCQAERVRAILGESRCTAWRCRGFSKDGGAKRLWHITASELHDDSFPLLKTISPRGFKHAVAFHGLDDDVVLVGGTAPLSLRTEVAEAIHCVVKTAGIDVRLATEADDVDGDNPNNIVNRLTADRHHGVQIEQAFAAREGFWDAISDAVAAVYRRRR